MNNSRQNNKIGGNDDNDDDDKLNDNDELSLSSGHLQQLELVPLTEFDFPPDIGNYASNKWNVLWTGGDHSPNVNTPALPPFNATALLQNLSDTQQPSTLFSNALPNSQAMGGTAAPQTLLLPFHPIRTEVSNEPRRQLNRDAFQADKEVSTGEAIVYCLKTNKAINVNSSVEVKKAVEELKQLKKNIKETVHSYLIQDILMNCKAITLPCGATPPTRRIDDICEVWAQNPSLVQHLWTVLVK
jgi:hypothetical protein